MANIRENKKNGKVISFRFTVCLERDVRGKQIRKYTTWTAPADLTPAKARKAAERAADAWEEEVKVEYQKQKKLGSAYRLPPDKRRDDFVSFVNDTWFVLQIRGENDKPNTIAFYMHTSDIEYRVEMVTPKLTYAELPRLQECVRQVRHAGAKANISCGIHVHVDAANHNRQSLKNLLSIMYSKEDILFKALQVNERRASRWCQKVREPMLKEARKLSSDETKNLTALESIWYEGNISDREHYNWTRYYALNLHSVFYRGTVEWRCFNSTLHAGKIAAYVNLCLAMSAQAINQRSTVMRKTMSDNELFTFRVWLVRLGLNGEEFKNTRNHLLANLDGDRAWRYDKDSYEVNKKKKKSREMER